MTIAVDMGRKATKTNKCWSRSSSSSSSGGGGGGGGGIKKRTFHVSIPLFYLDYCVSRFEVTTVFLSFNSFNPC